MPTSNGHAEYPGLLQDYQHQVLALNQQFSDSLMMIGKGYQEVAEAAVKASFAQVKALSSLVTPQAEE
ncbi:MAG: hypothetical protein EXR48_06270 [Dehalococcoidia bacterium]|nr:hypothetical protein [Dehalococcoidia bacterium]